jgi:hypothetical protein
VLVQVRHAVPGPYSDGLAYDLIPNCLDEQNLFMNPRWGWQSPVPAPSPVSIDIDHPQTAQHTEIDNPSLLKQSGFFLLDLLSFGFLSVCHVDAGHLNWFDVTYTGRVTWDKHDSGLSGDDDYNLWLYTPQIGSSPYSAGGMTEDSTRRRIRLEFDSDETIDEFTTCGFIGNLNCSDRFLRTWWNRFRHLVDDDDAGAHREIDGHLATAVGLMGVDYMHDPNSGNEIHPVHVLAVHLDRTASDSDPTHFSDHWAVFARNWGNEGECSALDHYVLENDLKVRLAPTIKPDYMSFIAGQSTSLSYDNVGANFRSALPMGFLPLTDDSAHPDVLLTFFLRDPPEHTWYVGDFQVDWTLSQPLPPDAFVPVVQPVDGESPPASSPTALVATAKRAASDADDAESGEAILKEIWNSMTAAQQADALALYQSLYPQRPLPDVYLVGAVRMNSPPPRPQQVPDVGHGPLPDWQLLRRTAQLSSICAATSGAPLGQLGTCADGPPVTVFSATGGAPGKNGWMVTPLEVTLTARDVSGAGVDHSEYSFDGISFQRYSGPFTAPEGDGVLFYDSVGRDGLQEIPRQQRLRIDTRPPVSAATAAVTEDAVVFAYAIDDPLPGSGAAGLHLVYRTVQGETAVATSAVEAGASGSANLPTRCANVEYWAEDQAGNEEAPHHSTGDQTPPTLNGVPDAVCLWPPNHPRIRFGLGTDIPAAAADECDPAPRVRIVAVTSNQDTGAPGSGHTADDATFSEGAVCVRAERSGMGGDRVYTVTVEANDAAGNATRKEMRLIVPHSSTPGCSDAGTEIADGAPCE